MLDKIAVIVFDYLFRLVAYDGIIRCISKLISFAALDPVEPDLYCDDELLAFCLLFFKDSGMSVEDHVL